MLLKCLGCSFFEIMMKENAKYPQIQWVLKSLARAAADRKLKSARSIVLFPHTFSQYMLMDHRDLVVLPYPESRMVMKLVQKSGASCTHVRSISLAMTSPSISGIPLAVAGLSAEN